MAGFVDDETDLDYPKTAQRPTRAGAEDHTLRAEDWNRLCQAAVDLRTAVLALRAAGGGIGVGSISLVLGGIPGGTVNASTEGTVDWLAFNTFQDPVIGASSASTHSKRAGHWLKESFSWCFAGQGMSTGAGFSGQQHSTTGSDSTSNSSMSATTNGARMFSLASPTNGWGFRFRVPAYTQRVLRIYYSHFSSTVDVTASLTDGSAVAVTQTSDSGASTTLSQMATITYAGGTAGAGCELEVTVFVASRYTADPNLGVGAIALATV